MNRPVAIVTWTGSGIGAAIITHLQLDPDVHSVVAQAARTGASARVITGDLTEHKTLDALAAAGAKAADASTCSSERRRLPHPVKPSLSVTSSVSAK